MFAFWFMLAWSVMNAYVTWGVASVLPAGLGRPVRVGLGAAALALAATLPVARAVRESSDPVVLAIVGPIEALGTTWLGVVFLTSCCLLVADVTTGFGLALRGRAAAARRRVGVGAARRWLRIGALAAGASLSIVASVQGRRAPSVTDYEVALPGLPAALDGAVLAVASDLHVGRLIDEEWLADRVEEILALRPVAILLVGDVLDGRSAVDAAGRFVPVLRRLATPGVALGTFAVLGNHEAHAGHAAAAALFRRAGIRVLADEWVEAAPGLVLAGIVDHAWHHVAGEDPGRIDRALAGRPPGAATVFLSHRPGDAERVAAAGARSGSPVGLMLSGHTHGGQVWPFSYAAERVNPVFEGRYEVGGMPVVVTRGAGTWGPRMRLWKRGEILRITVRATATPTSSARAP